MNVASLVSSFATSATYTVTRTARGTVTRGRVSAGTVSTLTIIASVSPATGRDMDRLPEGRQDSEARTVYTTTPIFIGAPGTAYEADQINIENNLWEVSHVETWVDPKSRASTYKVIVTRE